MGERKGGACLVLNYPLFRERRTEGMREKENETDRERREKERCVAQCSSQGHLACVSCSLLFSSRRLCMLALKMDRWKEGEARVVESPQLGSQ